ncbi:MAG: site-specific integrase [Pirellulales bacterium]|nr:site-specific integrase [Pirellulales bacterium]
MSEIQVKVASYGEGRNLMMTYRDPVTGKKVAKSTGTRDEVAAIGAAAIWQDELRTGRYQAPSKLTWADFRKRYEEEKLATLAAGTLMSATSALNHLQRVINPDRLAKLTAATLSTFQAKLRAEGMKDTTIASHLRHVKAALSWGEMVGLLPKAPKVTMPKRVKGQRFMRGRPITAEEYERMLLQTTKARPHDADQWKRYLTGLWLSGLRLEESLVLSWDQDEPFCVCLTGRRPAFRIYSEAQKSNNDQMLPMTPDFAQWLLETPEAERRGPVFTLNGLQTGKPITPKRISKIVTRIGRKANVVVNRETKWVNEEIPDPETGKPASETRRVQREVPKYASAHDLRRAFGTRWAPRVKPATLQLLMRHSSIETTLRHYVAQDSDDVADELWAGWGNTPATAEPDEVVGNTVGNTPAQEAQNAEGAPDAATSETPCGGCTSVSGGQGTRTLNR